MQEKIGINKQFKEDNLPMYSSPENLEQLKKQPDEEYKVLKAAYRKKLQLEKEMERKKRMKAREENEESIRKQTQYELIYPLISYEQEIFLEETYEFEEKMLKKQIENAKQLALELAGGNPKKMKFDIYEECYKKGVHDFVFELPCQYKDAQGNLIEKKPKT